MSAVQKTLQIANCKLQIVNCRSAVGNFQFSIFNFQFASLLILLTCVVQHLAAEPQRSHNPVSPQDSLEHLVVEDGLVVELAACEPNVIDPVAVRFDESGRMWVVEMRDYPTEKITGGKTYSHVKVLDDRDGDGFYETAAVVADNLRYATGVQPWKGGAFVTLAGKVVYLKDTSGDGKADIVETWYTGFAQKNTQLRANHPQLALDNHIYIANGLRGGEIVDARQPDARPVSISGMDFRFDPLTRKFEAVSGVGQFGLTFDDYNNRFVCSNRNPAMHVVLEDRYLKKNPLVAVPAVATDVAKAGPDSRLFPIGRSWTTSHLHANQFTAACGIHLYRGDALPANYYGNLFVCDPTAHLVHREVMKPLGVTFTSSPAADGREFLASRDEWFSPVELHIGPDGALYVVDMYRAVIEHPYWMPEELRKRPDLLEGIDRGRIYRVVPRGFKRPSSPRLSVMRSAELVELLAHPNSWWRETAARLLLERQDKEIVPQLQQMALAHNSTVARIRALRLLEALVPPDEELLLRSLDGADPRMVEQAIVAAEAQVDSSPALATRVQGLAAASPDARVRFQALLTARLLPAPPKFQTDQWELDAMLIAAGDRGGTVLGTMFAAGGHQSLATNIKEPKQFVSALARLAAASKNAQQWRWAVHALLETKENKEYARAGLIGFVSEIVRGGGSLDDLRAKLKPVRYGPSYDRSDVPPYEAEKLVDSLNRAFADAAADAANLEKAEGIRSEAIDLLAYWPDGAPILGRLALEDASQAIRLRAVAALAKVSGLKPWRELLSQFSSETPALQRAVLDGIFTNEQRIVLLLDEVAAGRVRPTEIDAARTKLLVESTNPEIKQRAAKLFAGALPKDREQALAEYQAVLGMKPDPARGRAVFEKSCATCHRIDTVGVDVAPDISDSRERLPAQLLTDIIQPNRAIDSNYFSYTATTTDGLIYTGVLTAETSTSITLKQAEGKAITLPRDQIDELRSDGVSFMPDGLEKNIPPQAMADLIAFIKNWRYLSKAPKLAQ
jgi:putative membrane-bound dehydrogenase-like protein